MEKLDKEKQQSVPETEIKESKEIMSPYVVTSLPNLEKKDHNHSITS